MNDRQNRPDALVTGPARGTGAATSDMLARDGCAVTVADILDMDDSV